MKHNLSIATTLALSLLVVPACKKDKNEGGDKAETSEKSGAAKAKGKTGEKASAKAKSPGTSASSDVISHFPADTEVVVALNLANITGSKMWKDYGPAAMANAGEEYGEFKEACGFDPLTTVKSIHVGLNTSNSEEPVIVVNGVSRSQVTKCVTAMAAKEGKTVTLTDEGNFTVAAEGDEKTAIGWINDTTMVVVPKKGDTAFLQARIDGKDGLKGNKGFEASVGKANQDAPIWFAANFSESSPAAKTLGAMGPAPTGVFGSFGFDGGLDIAIGATFSDAKTAEETLNMVKPLLGMAKGQLGPAGGLVDKLELATKAADLLVGLKLTDADIESLKSLAGPMLGGMGGL